MRTRISRPTIQRPQVQRQHALMSVMGRPERSIPMLRRTALPAIVPPAVSRMPPTATNFAPGPYVDYSRVLTPEGGVLITYKTTDTRFRYTLRRLFLWSCATGGEAWYLYQHSPVASPWINIALLIAVAIINWKIVKRPVEIYSHVEIRPDGMILDGRDIFWLRNMENGWPSFHRDDNGDQQLSGTYGTRRIDYLTAHSFDPLDQTPQVLAAHIQDAMRQLWTRHY